MPSARLIRGRGQRCGCEDGACIERMRFTALAAEIAAAFPDDHGVKLCALNRWWLLMGNAVAANPAIAPNIK